MPYIESIPEYQTIEPQYRKRRKRSSMAYQLIMIRTFMKYWREVSLPLSFFALLFESWGDKRQSINSQEASKQQVWKTICVLIWSFSCENNIRFYCEPLQKLHLTITTRCISYTIKNARISNSTYESNFHGCSFIQKLGLDFSEYSTKSYFTMST